MDKFEKLLKLLPLIEESNGGKKKGVFTNLEDKYVIVRSRNEGVNAGFVVCADETGIVLREARRLHYHKPKNKESSWYEGVAKHGLHKDSRVSEKAYKVIVESYSITACTIEAQESIVNFPTHESN